MTVSVVVILIVSCPLTVTVQLKLIVCGPFVLNGFLVGGAGCGGGSGGGGVILLPQRLYNS